MTKNDLKSGMTVKLRNGDIFLVINDFIANNDSFKYFATFDNNLVDTYGFKHLDIIEVYELINPNTRLQIGNLTTLLDLTSPSMKLLWKRQELPKLSSAERIILENLDKQYKWISRDMGGHLFVYFNKPTKKNDYWTDVPNAITYMPLSFPDLFKFVKWKDEQPYSIDELLKKGEQ